MTNITHRRGGVGVRPVIIFHLFTLWQLPPLASCLSSLPVVSPSGHLPLLLPLASPGQLPLLIASFPFWPVTSPPCQLALLASVASPGAATHLLTPDGPKLTQHQLLSCKSTLQIRRTFSVILWSYFQSEISSLEVAKSCLHSRANRTYWFQAWMKL